MSEFERELPKRAILDPPAGIKHNLGQTYYDYGKEVTIKLIKKFLKDSLVSIKKDIEFQLKNGTWNEDIKNNTKDKKYWKGFRYGISSFLIDHLIPEIEKWEKILKESLEAKE